MTQINKAKAIIVSTAFLASLLVLTLIPRQITAPVLETSQIVKQLSQKDLDCLAKNVYFEAGNQSVAGQVAVALVTLNRTTHPMFPSSICKVVSQGSMEAGKPTGRRCQFSWFCNGKSNEPNRKSDTWAQAVRVAIDAHTMFHKGFDITNGATHFHATYVNPGWSKVLTKVARIDDHIFYKRAK